MEQKSQNPNEEKTRKAYLGLLSVVDRMACSHGDGGERLWTVLSLTFRIFQSDEGEE